VQQQQQNCGAASTSNTSTANGNSSSGSDITLAALLANPLPHQQQQKVVAGAGSSPTKISPLLQQLQQPVQTQQPPPRVYPGLTSPRGAAPPSPRLTTTSPRPVASPRGAGSGMPPSPGRMMQPPPRYPSILSAQLSQPPKSVAVSGQQQQQHMLLQNSSQGLMAVTSQGLVPVTHHQNVLQVTKHVDCVPVPCPGHYRYWHRYVQQSWNL
jgi:hypothetical protein